MKEVNFSPFPFLTTERLTLRQLKDADDLIVFLLRSNDIVNRYINRQKPKNIDEVKAFIIKINEGIINNKCLYWAICLKENPELIGTICLWNFTENKTIRLLSGADLGYELNPSFHRQGIMNEAIQGILKYAFQSIGLKTICANTHRDNQSSIRLLLKNNFKQDSALKDEGNSNNIVFTLGTLL